MHMRKLFVFSAAIALTANAQAINVRGKVADQSGKPVVKAIVELLRQKLKDTTGADGAYAITGGNVAIVPPIVPQTEKISLKKGMLEFSLTAPSPVRVEMFDVAGDLLKMEYVKNAAAGVYRMNLLGNVMAAQMMVVRASTRNRDQTFQYLPPYGGKYAVKTVSDGFAPIGGRLTKVAAAVDSLKITADGFTTKVLTIDSYDKVMDVKLDSASGTSCLGCGKTDHPASGKFTMTVDGTQREYTLLLPDSYDPGKQYKLIFCPHWLGGTMNDVISGASCNGPYYGLKALANNTAIFIAPNGLKGSMGTGWENKNGADIKFFKAMLAHFDSTLCVDRKRIFSVGFSYGGMMSFAIACAMSDVFRAIAPMSGSLYSGCDNTVDHPIAMWQAHGNNDNVVPLADGKKGLDIVLKKNGCGSETTPIDPSPCVQYKGCREGYPVIYCEFSGGHGVQNFAAAAVWKFFNQF
jgi:polyhydroxybutyrate depolymerase